ncbi:MAG: protein-tyrosine-phosphatase [Chryseosolibacter sp.]
MDAEKHTEKEKLFAALGKTVAELTTQFDRITADRKEVLNTLTQFVSARVATGQTASLNFICTHNSRRSHIAQLWGQAAAHYYGVSPVACYSGGTEATAFNPRAVQAMRKAGFDIREEAAGANPVYAVKFSNEADAVKTFSKKFDDAFNPSKDFAAIMTCSHADENCPFVAGASQRIAITYDDPKDFDGTPLEDSKYNERVLQIGREILFAFSRVK